MIEELKGSSPTGNVADEEWYNLSVAVMVCLPLAIALLLAAVATVSPAWNHWRECVADNPAFPPSIADFFLRGQTTSLERVSPLEDLFQPEGCDSTA